MPANTLTPEDYIAIHRLIADYCHMFDRGDFDGFLGLFTEDATWTRMNSPPATLGGSGLPQETVRGKEAIRKLIVTAQQRFRHLMRHQQTNIAIDQDGPDRAKSLSYGMITDWRNGQGKLAMFANYHNRFRKTEEGWRFESVVIDLLPK